MELTDRQLQVIKLVADGYTSSEIAEILGLSPGTIAAHRHAIYRKLKVESAASAVRRCWENGWLV